jgi:hypothetical protein
VVSYVVIRVQGACVDRNIQHIGLSVPYAREFLEYPNVGFNIWWPLLQTSAGKKFVKEAKDSDRAVFVWTINDEDTMK